MLQEVRTELCQESPDRDLLLNYLNIIFLKVIKAVQASEEEYQAGLNFQLRKNFVHRITSLVDRHFRAEKRTSFYANELCIAPNTLTKYMKKYVGVSLTQLIHDRIVMEAKKEFYLTNKSIKEIAFDLGFDDPLYFSRVFKKLTKLCPSEYRE
jgi:AraC-like DNA-binding protein